MVEVNKTPPRKPWILPMISEFGLVDVCSAGNWRYWVGLTVQIGVTVILGILQEFTFEVLLWVVWMLWPHSINVCWRFGEFPLVWKYWWAHVEYDIINAAIVMLKPMLYIGTKLCYWLIRGLPWKKFPSSNILVWTIITGNIPVTCRISYLSEGFWKWVIGSYT